MIVNVAKELRGIFIPYIQALVMKCWNAMGWLAIVKMTMFVIVDARNSLAVHAIT